jgi:hypothetical protein
MKNTAKVLVILGLLMSPLGACAQVQLNARAEGGFLVLKGQVIDVSVVPSPTPTDSIDIRFKIRFELVNEGKVPVLFLTDDLPALNALTLTKNAGQANDENTLFDEPGGESLSEEAVWRGLRVRLNQPLPPQNNVHVLSPGEKWEFQTSTFVRPPLKYGTRTVGGHPTSWEILKNTSSLYLRVQYIFWPYSLEKPPHEVVMPFGHMLQKKWRHIGILQLEPIVSEPMLIKLPDAPPPTQLQQ